MDEEQIQDNNNTENEKIQETIEVNPDVSELEMENEEFNVEEETEEIEEEIINLKNNGIRTYNVNPLPHQEEILTYEDYVSETHEDDEIIYDNHEKNKQTEEEHPEEPLEEKPITIVDKILKIKFIRQTKYYMYDNPKRFFRTFHTSYYWKNPHSWRGEITRRKMLKSQGYVVLYRMWYSKKLRQYRIEIQMEKGKEVVKRDTEILSKYDKKRQVHITGQKKRWFLFDSHLTPQEREKERGFGQVEQYDYMIDTSGDDQLDEQIKPQRNDRDWTPVIVVGVLMMAVFMYLMYFR